MRLTGWRRRSTGALVLPVVLVLTACDAPPVAWQEPQRGGAPAVASVGAPEGVKGGACAGSERVAAGRAAERYAVWWRPRADSSVVLLIARSTDGGTTWSAPVVVDSLDRGVRACARPAPALAADSINGYVHVVYFLDAPEGPGLFYAHQMDPRAPFEPPSTIVYGERPVAAAVASRGDTVVVAYEDPNRPRPQVELALSRTGGHLFEERHLDVSPDDVAARAPRVALGDGGRLTVAWTESQGDEEGGGKEVLREGRIR
jgi:hypothetical protein